MAFENNRPIIQVIPYDSSGSCFGKTGNPFHITGSVIVASVMSGSYAGQIEGRSSDGGNFIGNPVTISGLSGSTNISIAVDDVGRIITAPAGSAVAASSAGFRAGYVTTAATTRVSVRATAYVEQSNAVQRSIVSSNAADSSTGTGCRTAKITYYDSSGNGPFFEIITLNGTTAVNTTNSNIRFIESIEVVTVGSNGTNVGIISLKASTSGAGATIGSIAAGDNITFWSHHYVPNGKTCYVTGLSVGHNGTTVGSGGVFTLNAIAIGVSNVVEKQVSDIMRLYGQSSTVPRVYGTAIKVIGPAKITMYLTPESSKTLTYRGSFDFYDQ